MPSDRGRTGRDHAWGAMKHWNGPVTETRRTVFDFPWSGPSITASHAGRPHGVHAPRCRLQSPDPPMLPMSRDPRPLSPVAMQASRSRLAFRQSFWLVVLVTALAVAVPLRAQEPAPRVGAPQQPDAVHTVRQIPEACVRLEGRYAQPGAATPYVLQVVPVGGNCQPRARYLDGGRAQPSASAGWLLNDEIRIPEAACPGREAVVQVWRKAGDAVPARDGQGQTRVYLEESRSKAASAASALGQFSAVLQPPAGRCG